MDSAEPQPSPDDGRSTGDVGRGVILEVDSLSVVYEREEYALTAVDRVSFDVLDGEFVVRGRRQRVRQDDPAQGDQRAGPADRRRGPSPRATTPTRDAVTWRWSSSRTRCSHGEPSSRT